MADSLVLPSTDLQRAARLIIRRRGISARSACLEQVKISRMEGYESAAEIWRQLASVIDGLQMEDRVRLL